MELSKINVKNRDQIKEVLGFNDSDLVKLQENDLLSELLATILLFDDEEKNRFIPRIKSLSEEITEQKQKISALEQKLLEVQKQLIAKPEKKKAIAASSENTAKDGDSDAEILEKNKKQISAFLKKKLAVIDNGELESIHPKLKDLEEEVLRLLKENSDLNTLIAEDVDLIDALMAELKKHQIEWSHSLIEKREPKLKLVNASFQPFDRLFIYKKLLSIPKLELTIEKVSKEKGVS